MPSLNYTSVEVKMGFFLTFSLALFVAMLFLFGRVAPVWRARQEIFVAFENVGGLTADAPVRYNGMEIGRVKWLRILHLDDATIDRLPPLTKRDLDNLPLHPAALVHELRDVADVDFNSVCREKLKNRTMIEICLELLQEGDVSRFHDDDKARVVGNFFNDTAVEIIAGTSSKPLDPNSRLMLGTSGDFFGNLSKSMGEVKDILSNVTDVVGIEERKSFERAQGRLHTIDEKMDEFKRTSERRWKLTMNSFEAFSKDSKTTFNKMETSMKELHPMVAERTDRIRDHLKDLQEHIKLSRAEAEKSVDEISEDARKLRTDFRGVLDQARPNFEEMKKNIRGVYDKMGGLSYRLDDIRDTAGALYEQSGDDLERFKTGIKQAMTNFNYARIVAEENKDLMISNADVGEHQYNTALSIYQHICRADQRIQEAASWARELSEMAAQQPDASPELKSEADNVITNLFEIRKPLGRVVDRVEEKMLPAFDRKKAGWKEAAPTGK
jgi:hypothetical protein